MTAAASLRCCRQSNPARQQCAELCHIHTPTPRSICVQHPPAPHPQGTPSSSQVCHKCLNHTVMVPRVRKVGGGKFPSQGAEQLV